MATSASFIEYAAERVKAAADGRYSVRYKKMFGEYMIYVNEKPIVLVCDDTVFVRRRAEFLPFLEGLAETGFPYDGAKEHYILDIEDAELTARVIDALEPVTPLPKPKKPKTAKAANPADGDPIGAPCPLAPTDAKSASVGGYISEQAADVQPLLQALRETIRAAAPDSVEKIAWNMPTFWQKENLIHFAVNKKHIGIYPGGQAVGVFSERLTGYKTSKGAIQLPLKRGDDGAFEPLDYALVADIMKWRLENI